MNLFPKPQVVNANTETKSKAELAMAKRNKQVFN